MGLDSLSGWPLQGLGLGSELLSFVGTLAVFFS
jgi:hypothetical protein